MDTQWVKVNDDSLDEMVGRTGPFFLPFMWMLLSSQKFSLIIIFYLANFTFLSYVFKWIVTLSVSFQQRLFKLF